jgi:hypothetical protein
MPGKLEWFVEWQYSWPETTQKSLPQSPVEALVVEAWLLGIWVEDHNKEATAVSFICDEMVDRVGKL